MSNTKNYFDKIGFGRIAIIIGVANWIIVVITLKMPGLILHNFLAFYLSFFSFIPALISLGILKKVDERYRYRIKSLNISYLVFYSMYVIISIYGVMNA